MFTREFCIILSAALVAGHSSAQQSDTEEVPRTSAEVPERLPETGERAPESPPQSSAQTIENIDADAFVFGVGQPATPEEIAAIDIDLMPDGTGLPEGSGTFAEGEQLYQEYCAACHAEDLGGISDLGAARLIGGRGTLDSDSPVKTVESYWPYASTLFDYVHRAMPMDAPGSLDADEIYAINAYILGRAGILDEDTELNAETYSEIVMPNVDGFVPDPRPDTQ